VTSPTGGRSHGSLPTGDPASVHDPPSPPRRDARIVIHWTAGHKNGDLATLDGPNVDCHFYVDKDGDVFEFLDSDLQAWHAFHTANPTCIGIVPRR
jgi:N-acetyl-anhydromuramyl-L-alanine amidase AmpD